MKIDLYEHPGQDLWCASAIFFLEREGGGKRLVSAVGRSIKEALSILGDRIEGQINESK